MRVDVSDGRSTTATPTVQNWSSASGTTFGIGYFDPTYTASYGWGGRVYSVAGVNRKLAELEIDALFAFTKRYAVF